MIPFFLRESVTIVLTTARSRAPPSAAAVFGASSLSSDLTGGPAGIGGRLSMEESSSLVLSSYLSIFSMVLSIYLNDSFESS